MTFYGTTQPLLNFENTGKLKSQIFGLKEARRPLSNQLERAEYMIKLHIPQDLCSEV